MIQANDILLAARSRLNDTDTKKYRWSDEELIDYINSSLADISKELECFTHKEHIYIKNRESRYRLPHDILRVLSLFLSQLLNFVYPGLSLFVIRHFYWT